MDMQSMVPSAYRDGFKRTDRCAPSKMAPTRASGAKRYNRQSSLGRQCISSSLPAWLYLRRGAESSTLALFTGLYREPRIPNQELGRQKRPKYMANVIANTNPWIETMKPYMPTILGSGVLGTKTLALLSAAWAPNTTTSQGNTICRYFDLCEEHILAPLVATPAHMARYVAWLGQLGTMKASSLQFYISLVNGFFKDHGLEATALSDLVAKVRKGLAASHVGIEDTLVRFHLPASIIAQALRMAQALRLQFTDSITRAALQTSPARDQVRLLRACMTVVILYFFFSRGGLGRLLNGGPRRLRGRRHSLVPKKRTTRSVIIAQNIVSPSAHGFHGSDSNFIVLDYSRCTLSGEKYPTARWAIDVSEKYDKWIAHTLTSWLHEATSALRERPPECFSCTSHSLRKGAATADNIIGITL
jgi:hypothetical protein